jgi:hypothetical protein
MPLPFGRTSAYNPPRKDPFYNYFEKMEKIKSHSTIKVASSVCRKLLNELGVEKNKLKTPCFKKENIKEKPQNELPIDLKDIKNNENLYKFIFDRFNIIKNHTRCKSLQTQKVLLRYWVNIFQSFGDLKTLNPNNLDFSIKNVIEIVKNIIVNDYYIIYLHHLFYEINNEWNIKLKDIKKYFPIIQQNNTEDGDKDKLVLPHIIEVQLNFTPIGSQTGDLTRLSNKEDRTNYVSHIAQNFDKTGTQYMDDSSLFDEGTETQ